MVVEIGDVRVDGDAIARFQKFLSKDLLFIEKEYAIVQSAERAVDVGIDSEEGSGKPLDVLNAHPRTAAASSYNQMPLGPSICPYLSPPGSERFR